MLSNWDKEIYGHMNIICFNKDKVLIYCKESNRVYDVPLMNKRVKHKKISFFSILTSFMPVYDIYYFDVIVNIQSNFDNSLETCQSLYEHIYNILLENKMLLSCCFAYSHRSLQKDNFLRIFMDYTDPLCAINMGVEDLESCIKLCCLVCSSEYMKSLNILLFDEVVVAFLKERKKKYFSDIDRSITNYERKMELKL